MLFINLLIILPLFMMTCSTAQAEKNNFIRACYYTSWSQNRTGIGRFGVENYQPGLCTHIFYAFAYMSPDYNLIPMDPDDDYSHVLKLKLIQPDLKILLTFGGFQYSQQNEKLLQFMMVNRKTRERFFDSILTLLKTHDFDGFDMAVMNTRRKKHFSILVNEMKQTLRDHGKNTTLIAVSISGSPGTMTRQYDLTSLADSVDILNVISYSFHGPWDHVTGHSSPLFDKGNEKLSVKTTAEAAVNNGFPKQKIVLSLSTFGYGWKLKDPSDKKVGAPVSGLSPAGSYTKEPGMLASYEICSLVSANHEIVDKGYDDVQQGTFITVNRTFWYSFDDKRSFETKLTWIKDGGYGGVSVWSLDLDDFNGVCSKEKIKFPLISLAKEVMERTSLNPIHQTLTTTTITTTISRDIHMKCTKVGYQKNPYSCTSFYFCVALNVKPELFQCAKGLHFDPKREQCDIPEKVRCK